MGMFQRLGDMSHGSHEVRQVQGQLIGMEWTWLQLYATALFADTSALSRFSATSCHGKHPLGICVVRLSPILPPHPKSTIVLLFPISLHGREPGFSPI